MAKKWILKAHQGRLTSSSNFQRSDLNQWIRENDGKFLIVTPREKISREKRGYFEGAIIPTYCHWHEALDPKNADHRAWVREELKQEFNGVTIKGISGKPHKVSKSTAGLTNHEFGKFLNRITDYFAENEIPIPDPELYKLWVDMHQDEYGDYWEWLQAHNMSPDGTGGDISGLTGK